MDDPGDLTSYDDLSEVFPSPVYESNTQELEQLSNEEARKISQFYTALMAHRGMTSQQSPTDDNEDATESMNDSVDGLRTDAVEAINNNL